MQFDDFWESTQLLISENKRQLGDLRTAWRYIRWGYSESFNFDSHFDLFIQMGDY